MKTTKNFFFVSLLIGSLFTSNLFLQGQSDKSSSDNLNYSLQLFVYAGGDATICDNEDFQTQGVTTFTGTTLWKTSGDGFFENPYDLQTIYLPGEQDIANGEVNLNLLYVENEGSRSKATVRDSMTLSFGNCSVVKGLER